METQALRADLAAATEQIHVLVGALDEEQVGPVADRAVDVEPAAATHRLGGETLQTKPDGRAQANLIGQVTVADET